MFFYNSAPTRGFQVKKRDVFMEFCLFKVNTVMFFFYVSAFSR